MSTAREDDVARGAEGAPRADVAVPDRATEAKGGEALPAPTPEDGAGTRVVRVGSGVAVPIGGGARTGRRERGRIAVVDRELGRDDRPREGGDATTDREA